MDETSELDRSRPVALVTGARQGIGLSVATHIASAGFDVVLSDVSADLGEACDAVRAAGGNAHPLVLDISDVDAVPGAVDKAWSAFGKIDCLVNNAGIAMRPLTDLLKITPDQYDKVMDINLRGTFFVAQAVANRMLEEVSSHHRSIITITSIASRMVNLDRSPYHLSKAGLSMLNELLALRLADHGIASYEIMPGYMRTSMTASATPTLLDQKIRDGRVPQRRWGSSDDVGATITALATGALPYSTGQAVWVDGGLHINQAD